MTDRRLLDPASKLLLDAADYMELHGWCRKTLSDDAGRVCVEGAILVGSGGKILKRASDKGCYISGGAREDIPRALQKLSAYLKKHNQTWAKEIGITDMDLCRITPAWNDLKCRSKKQAVTALRAAAINQ
jgi:hypothetical protein